jgi:hypothetical protein
MEHTSFTWNDHLAAYKAMGHEKGKTTNKEKQGSSFGAGYSIHTEAGEYAKFLMAMLDQRGLPPSYFEEMFKEQTPFKEGQSLREEVGQTGWGLGFAQKPSLEGMMHQHTGNNHDFQAYCMILPDKKYGIVLFTNSDTMETFLENFNILGKQF